MMTANRFQPHLVLVGIPEYIRPLTGIPEGARVRYRFRYNNVARAFVRHNGTTTKGIICDCKTHWEFLPEAQNVTQLKTKNL